MNKKPLIITMIIVVCCWVLMELSDVAQRYRAIQTMDAKELQYDAYDWFVMIDLNSNLIGVYDGIKPIEHQKLETDLSYYPTPIVVLWKEVKQHNVKTYLDDYVPVLIYKG